MAERPILFSGEMVKAILDGRKTQTRRVVKPQPEPIPGDVAHHFKPADTWWRCNAARNMVLLTEAGHFCPYAVPGDVLWVKETMVYKCIETQEGSNPADILRLYGHVYAADDVEVGAIPDVLPDNFKDLPRKAIPSIFMPRWASRITLKVEEVRVQRVADLTPDDAIAEGISPTSLDPVHDFAVLWDGLNAKRGYDFKSAPWVWAISFTRCDPERGTGN